MSYHAWRKTVERWRPRRRRRSGGRPASSSLARDRGRGEALLALHDFDEALEAGGEEVTYEAQATRRPRTHVYRVLLDDLEMSTVQALAKRRGVNASVVLRELVRAARARPAKAGETASK